LFLKIYCIFLVCLENNSYLCPVISSEMEATSRSGCGVTLIYGKALSNALSLTHRNLAVPTKQIVKSKATDDAH
jgi:hypothetical protein